jgi:enoyl-[acyl-carrier protein] reductase I
MSLLSGKRGLVVGIANERSIAFGIARAAKSQGAELALTYQDDRLRGRVETLARDLDAVAVMPCDVTHDQQIAEVAERLAGLWGHIDFLVHAVAFAERGELAGRFVDISRPGFATALDVSVYSLVALVAALESALRRAQGASVLTLTYYGSEKAVPNYHLMGVAKAALEATVRYLALELGPAAVRVNALSPGPIKTLSAAGVRGLRSMLAHVQKHSPLERAVDIDDVGRAALFTLSDLSAGVSGEVIHVDAGYHITGTPRLPV